MPENTHTNSPKPPIVDPKAQMIRDYLAERETPCPACGYNLRGLETGLCPECGETLSLHLHPASPMARRTGLIVLVFLWLLATSGLQSWHIGRSIHQQITNPFLQVISINTSGSLQLSPQFNKSFMQLQQNLDSLQTDLFMTADALEVEVADQAELATERAPANDSNDTEDVIPGDTQGDASSSTTIFTVPSGNAPTTSWSYRLPGGGITPAFGGSNRYNWRAVSWQQWTKAGLWLTLGFTALAGFILLLLVRRRREPSPGLIRTIPILAWSGFGGYIGLHLLSTVLELF